MPEDWNRRRSKLEPEVDKLLAFYMAGSCPCHFPRFRHVTSFFHRNFKAGPVLSLETEYCCYLSYAGANSFLEKVKSEEGSPVDYTTTYTCKNCGSKYKEIWNQYSINFDCRYFEIELSGQVNDKGVSVVLPIPLYGGLAGFDDNDVALCRSEYSVGTLDEFIDYMTETI